MTDTRKSDSSSLNSRRNFLRAAGSAVAVTASAGISVADADTPENSSVTFNADPFSLGVASGDPLPTAVVIWTRLAPNIDEENGGMPDENVPVQWEVASDEDMQHIIENGTATAEPEYAHTVHVDVQGLKPGTEYYYRFTVDGSDSSIQSRVGRMKSAPAPTADNDELQFAFASCQHYQSSYGGYYNAYADMADQDLDLVFHLGDYIYEGGRGDGALGRGHKPPHPLSDISDYRTRYAQYKSDPDLRDAHAAAPWIVTWDDHEVVNNYADEEDNSTPTAEFLKRRADAYQAYWEHQPLRWSRLPDGPNLPLYRRFQYGTLAEFNVLDTRQYRDDQPGSAQAADSPYRTLLGDTQEEWLVEGLEQSDTDWNVLAQQVPFAATDENSDPDEVNFGAGDKWDGYQADRQTLLNVMTEQDDLNPVVITGDVHRNYVYNIKSDFTTPSSETVATEFVGTSISSSGDGSGMTTYGESANTPWEQFYNDNRGYVLCTVTSDEWQTDYRVVSTVSEPESPASTVESFVVENGNPGAKLAPVESPANANSVESRFDSGDENWRLVGDPESRQPTYNASGGNGGGYISGIDGSAGVTWYYSAPAKFLGKKTGFYSGALMFDLRQARTDSQYENADDIVLRGDGVTLAYDLGDTSTNPGDEWTSYEVPLKADAGWVKKPSGSAATASEMLTVLRNLAQILVRGEYRSGSDSSSLDNVVLSRR